MLPFHSTVGVAASTLAVAALFNPLRRRVQRVVNRRFNRARYDADRIVAAFAARLKDEVDLDSIRDDLAGVVHRALEPEPRWRKSRHTGIRSDSQPVCLLPTDQAVGYAPHVHHDSGRSWRFSTAPRR